MTPEQRLTSLLALPGESEVAITGHVLDAAYARKLPEVLDEKKKNNKVKNLLQALKNEGVIRPQGKSWQMSKSDSD